MNETRNIIGRKETTRLAYGKFNSELDAGKGKQNVNLRKTDGLRI